MGQALTAIPAGELPELAKATHVDFVDIESSHWPMFPGPGDLPGILTDGAAD